MIASLSERRASLVAALGFARLEPRARELRLIHSWLSNWSGLGLVAVGMERQGYRLHLTNIEEDVWRATFSRSAGLAHDGFGAAATPWGAVQHAAWSALAKAETDAR